eukprot:CAMPEP_0118944156 /NCGR_PEP_ID=MMETSP1169-20130426/39749_1 /TAXON_ID=36882 /ORGANISM="Pyramimonas obovata, Strain CCMP722" /LENGTH=143 /DNA_ID=CAMNT_0006889583 /DNA_START=254 /DNA_END=681 /DNA_ORIENTATION=+
MSEPVWEKVPLLVLSARWYVFLNVLVATCIASGVNAAVAWLMYSSDDKTAKLSMWRIPDTVFGDLLVTALIEWVVTYLVSGYLALRDVTLRFPMGVAVSTIPGTWARALRQAPPLLFPIGCCFADGEIADETLQTNSADGTSG